jgi:hypothetical protein
MYQQQQQQQQQQQWMNVMAMEQQPMTTGHRQHYTTVPDLVPMFQPEVRSTMNFTSAKGLEKYNNPADAKVDKKEETQSFKPAKSSSHSMEDKQNLTTMINVFSSADSSSSNNSSNKKAVPEDDNKKPNSNSNADDQVTDLLVTFNDLAVSDETAVYPTKSAAKKPSDTALYPTKQPSTTTTKKPLPTDQHRKLLNQVSSWINDLYEQKKASAAPASSSVKVN